MELHLDSWPVKIAIVLAIVGVREFVRLLSPRDGANVTGESSRWIIETLDSFAIAIGLVLFVIQPFIMQAFYIPSGSMENTLMGPPKGQTTGGDRLLVSKLIYRLRDPHFQDVVVFRAPAPALGPGTPDGTDFIKRCIGTPGDVIYVINRKVYRIPKERAAKGDTQGVKVDEPYTKWSDDGYFSYDMKILDGVVYSREYDPDGTRGIWKAANIPEPDSEQKTISDATPQAVPQGKYLMLGDHRSNSNDSHVWGFVPRENVVGKAIFVFWPPQRMSLVDRLSRGKQLVRSAQKPQLQPETQIAALAAR